MVQLSGGRAFLVRFGPVSKRYWAEPVLACMGSIVILIIPPYFGEVLDFGIGWEQVPVALVTKALRWFRAFGTGHPPNARSDAPFPENKITANRGHID